jgi:hypothetical protein
MTTPKKPSVSEVIKHKVLSYDRALAPANTGTPMPKVKAPAPAPTTTKQNGNKKG